jgi:hypothetical protein
MCVQERAEAGVPEDPNATGNPRIQHLAHRRHARAREVPGKPISSASGLTSLQNPRDNANVRTKYAA